MGKSIVFLYPGQGAQEIGMGLDLYRSYPRARELFQRVDSFLGFSLSRLCFEGPDDTLNDDLNAQMAVYTLSCIITDVLQENGIRPAMVSGYSSGFYAAGYAAGCFGFEDGLEIVRCAGEILRNQGRQFDGTMAVVFGLSSNEIAHICQKIGNVQIAIFNTPRQTIISGLRASVLQAVDSCLEKGALDAYPLPVETAYHSSSMKDCSKLFKNEIDGKGFMDPEVPLLSYLSLAPVESSSALVKVMADQLSGPVLWVDLIKTLSKNNSRVIFEVGPGALISKTVQWIDRNAKIMKTSPASNLWMMVERYGALPEERERYKLGDVVK